MFQQTNIDAFLLVLSVSALTRVYLFGGWCMREQVQEQCLGMKVKLWGSCGAWGYGATVAQQPVQNMTKSKRGKWWSLILGKAASYIALWNSSHHMDLYLTTCIRPWEGAKPAPWYSVLETCKTQPDRCIFPSGRSLERPMVYFLAHNMWFAFILHLPTTGFQLLICGVWHSWGNIIKS